MTQSSDNPVNSLFNVWIEGLQTILGSSTDKGSTFDADVFDKTFLNSSQFNELSTSIQTLLTLLSKPHSNNHDGQQFIDSILQIFQRLYKQVLGDVWGGPYFGITREHQHKLSAALDAHNHFMMALSDFMVKFSIPCNETIKEYSATLAEADNETVDDLKTHYNRLVALLERRYDQYLKSSQGVENVAIVVDRYLDWQAALKQVKHVWARALSLPTTDEMDDVYRSIYQLKKQLRSHEKTIQMQQEHINQLLGKRKTAKKSTSTSRSRGAAKDSKTRKSGQDGGQP